MKNLPLKMKEMTFKASVWIDIGEENDMCEGKRKKKVHFLEILQEKGRESVIELTGEKTWGATV